METAVREIFDFYKSRIESPLFFSFIFAWCLFNHEFMYFLFFYSQPDKINHLMSFKVDILSDFIYPPILALTSILVLPALNNLVMQIKYKILCKVSLGAATNKERYDFILKSEELKKAESKLITDKKNLEEEIKKFTTEKNKFDIKEQATQETLRINQELSERYRLACMFMAFDTGSFSSISSFIDKYKLQKYQEIPFEFEIKNTHDDKLTKFKTHALLMSDTFELQPLLNFLDDIYEKNTVRIENKNAWIEGVVMNCKRFKS